MTGVDSGGRGSAAARIAGLAVLVVLAVVLARARAVGATPPVPTPPSRSVVRSLIQLVAVAVMVAAGVLLLWGGRVRRIRVPGAQAKQKRAPAGPPSRRVLIAALIGLLVGLGPQLLGNAVNEQNRAPPPPPNAEQPTGESPLGRERPPPRAQPESGIGDEVVLLAALLTLAALVFVLLRRDTRFEDDELVPRVATEEQRAIAWAVHAAREAVLDRAISDPRAAIVACFATMEDALADRGGAVTPRDADTPEEVLSCGIERASLPAEAAGTLLRLFREARYSSHPMIERDRTAADGALAVLLRTLGTPTGRLAGGPR